MKKQHDKLVRDKSPEKLTSKNIDAEYQSIKTNSDFYDCLLDKLNEEINEFLENDDIEELCDVVEVVDAILKFRNISPEDFNKMRDAKNQKNGKFDQRIFLVSTE